MEPATNVESGTTTGGGSLYAAICRSLERKSLIFLGLGFFFEPEGRGFESLPARYILSPRKRQRIVNVPADADST